MVMTLVFDFVFLIVNSARSASLREKPELEAIEE
jgi:hypothetical protein